MTKREELNQAISDLDDEAFSWLARACLKSAMLKGGGTQIWPDGLGGFRDREGIERVRTLANQLLSDGD